MNLLIGSSLEGKIIFICISIISIVLTYVFIKKTKDKMNPTSIEKGLQVPIPQAYTFMLKQYSKINNLNILNKIENQSMSIEVRELLRTSSSSGAPTTITRRYNSEIEFINKKNKSFIRMTLDVKRELMIIYLTTLLSLPVSILFFIFTFFGSYISSIFILIVFGSSILFTIIFFKRLNKTIDDQFQLLINKPLIQLSIKKEETEGMIHLKAPKAIFCKYCGKETEPDASICEHCGNSLS